MTEAEREALELLNEVWREEHGHGAWGDSDIDGLTVKAFVRALEMRNTLRADMAEIANHIRIARSLGFKGSFDAIAHVYAAEELAAKHRAEPDPLVEALEAAWGPDLSGDNYARSASSLRAELAKRGIELARKEQPNADR